MKPERQASLPIEYETGKAAVPRTNQICPRITKAPQYVSSDQVCMYKIEKVVMVIYCAAYIIPRIL
jgi:hypothetical protein